MLILLLILNVLLSSTFIVCAIAMQYAAPIFFIGMRMFITSSILFGYLFLRRNNYTVKREDVMSFLVLGLTHICIPFVGELYALKDPAAAAKVSLVWSLSPFLTALFAWFLFRERLTWAKLLGLCIGFFGVLLVIVYTENTCNEFGLIGHIGFADMVLLSAVISAAFAWNLFRKLLIKGYRPLVLNAWSMLMGGVLSLGLSPVLEVWRPVPVTNWTITLACLVFLVITGGIICYNLYGYLLRYYSTTLLSLAGGLIPFFTAVLQWLILGQPVHMVFGISLVITTLGLLIFYREELRRGMPKNSF